MVPNSTLASFMKTQSASPPRKYKWEMLGLLWLTFFLHQGDRQVFNAVLPLMHEGLGLSYVQLGLVATIFTLVYGLAVPVAGYLGDICQKRWVVTISLVTFSVGTLLTGFAGGIISLILFRSLATGLGESIYYPSANALIGQYHERTRAQAMAIHQTALYAGIVLSGWLAAWIGQTYGWRMAYIAFGAAGVLWAGVMALRLRNDQADAVLPAPGPETPEPAGEEPVLADANPVPVEVTPAPVSHPKVGEVLGYVLRRPTVYFFWVAFGGMVFVNIGFTTWMPTFLHEKFGLSLASAALNATVYHFAAAFLGVLAGARFSDKLAPRFRCIRVDVKIFGLLAASPFIAVLAFSDNLLWVYVAMGLFGFFRGIYDSNLFAALFDVIEPRYRATATGLMLAFAFMTGSLSSVILGWMKGVYGLESGMLLLAVVFALAGLVLLAARIFTFNKDRLPEPAAEPNVH
jgi:sugar phosphate permease